ncbi:uncharacterized protein LOC108632865 [Ceratina calcarata]|uniref:Uncharacterized protein LOC108632865 n=1 Tax=Ceratina calcarata TaxID=156304 RepID=A0AAJ7JI46_9HYME|nr:uncharacterized protein LOC108632865 [Ceratina calcarata]
MKLLLVVYCLLCLSMTRVQSKPQITRLFPVQREANVSQPEGTNDEAKPLDRLLGKLRATYDFVFRKPENTSNVEKILAKDTSKAAPEAEPVKSIWSIRMQPKDNGKNTGANFQPQRTYLGTNEDWANDIQPLDRLEPLELEDEVENEKDREVEFVTPRTGFQFPVTLSRHFVDWLGSLLGITYGVYSKLARIIYSNNTTIRVH